MKWQVESDFGKIQFSPNGDGNGKKRRINPADVILAVVGIMLVIAVGWMMGKAW